MSKTPKTIICWGCFTQEEDKGQDRCGKCSCLVLRKGEPVLQANQPVAVPLDEIIGDEIDERRGWDG